MVSFQSAYLRVHHPAEFIAAVLSNQGGFYRPHAYIAEARRMGLITMGPDINLSRFHYYGISNKGTVVIGFMAIKGLSASGINEIITQREQGGNFSSLEDFSRRVKLDRDDIIALCPAGVFDSINDGLSRPLQARFLLANNNRTVNRGNMDLFTEETNQKNKILLPCKDELWDEYQALGFLRNLHPLVLWKEEVLAVKNRVKALRISDYIGKYIKMIGWPVTQKDVWTKDGLTMCFLSLEDETALYETVVFPNVYEKYNRLLFDQQPLLVHGLVTNDEGAISLEVRKIETLKNQQALSIRVHLSPLRLAGKDINPAV
jgi:DNA polymerase-3 subunit alpha/error-prone DNA polymerase